MRVQVLGSVRAWDDRAEIDLGPPGRRAVLGLLVLAEGEAAATSDLVDALWGDRLAAQCGERAADPRQTPAAAPGTRTPGAVRQHDPAVRRWWLRGEPGLPGHRPGRVPAPGLRGERPAARRGPGQGRRGAGQGAGVVARPAARRRSATRHAPQGRVAGREAPGGTGPLRRRDDRDRRRRGRAAPDRRGRRRTAAGRVRARPPDPRLPRGRAPGQGVPDLPRGARPARRRARHRPRAGTSRGTHHPAARRRHRHHTIAAHAARAAAATGRAQGFHRAYHPVVHIGRAGAGPLERA